MKIIQFLKETKTEMKYVTWPTRRRSIIYTIAIILFSAGLGYTLYGFDIIFNELLKTAIIK